MDGHFVPNLSIGAPVVKCLRPAHRSVPRLPPDDRQPGRPARRLRQGRRGLCTIHVELGDPRPLFDRMRALGMRVGLVFNPETPVEAVLPYLEEIDILLFMSVHPASAARRSSPRCWTSCAAARRIVDERGLAVELEIDGGINVATAPLAPRPARTSSSRAARSSTPTTRSPRPRRSATRPGPSSSPAEPGRCARRCSPSRTASRKACATTGPVAALVARSTEAGFEIAEHRVSADGIDAVADALRPMTEGSPGWSSRQAAPGSARVTSRPKGRAR